MLSQLYRKQEVTPLSVKQTSNLQPQSKNEARKNELRQQNNYNADSPYLGNESSLDEIFREFANTNKNDQISISTPKTIIV